MKKLFLLDAYAIIYRAYYAFIRNPRINSKGLNTSAMFGFVNTIEEVLKKEQPTHMAVAFDPKGGTFRHKIFPEYKAQRESTPEDIKKSIPYIKEIIKAYNIPIIEVENFEADDVIGTLAKRAEKQDFKVYMLTPDKDYGQLVSENIFMYRPKHRGGYEVLGTKEIKEKYSINHVNQVIDLLGLMGDSSDNVPGCPGVGEKTAIKLITEFGSIDNLLENSDQLKGALKKKVIENKQMIKDSQFLVTIKTDVPIDFDEKALEVENINEEKLKDIFEDLEFRTIAKRIFNTKNSDQTNSEQQPTDSQQMSLFDTPIEIEEETEEAIKDNITTIKHNYQLVESPKDIANLLQLLEQQKSVCFDTETTGLDVFNTQIVGISFCWKKNEAFYVPLSSDRELCQEQINQFKSFFENDKIEKIGQNIKFDLLVLAQYDIHLKGELFDTMIAHYLIQPELRHGMDYLADIYLNYNTIEYDEIVGKGRNKISIREVPKEKLKDYASEDADITFQLKTILEKKLAENDLEKLFYQMEMPLLKVLAEMEQNGVKIDSEALKENSHILTQELLKLEREIIEIAGVEFNVGSPMQVGEVLFEKMKLVEKAKKTKSGQYSTSEDILKKIRSKHPIVGKILDYRGLKKLLSTYIDALPKIVNIRTNRIHSSYNQTVASTGRLSSTNPNLQNIPVRDQQGREIRKAFIPYTDELFLSVDYSQIELRIMAHLSEDSAMIEAFVNGQDIHTATASKIYKVPLNEVTSDMRRKAKTANFGIIYGISIFGLAERLSIPRAEAKELISGYFETYPKVKEYMEKTVEKAKQQGYVETIYGRKRYLKDINSGNSIVRGFAERNAINAPIQGSAADIIKLAMINIQRKLTELNLPAKMIMQVHDELNFSVPVEIMDKVINLVKKEMENVIELKVPLLAECGKGKNWLEAH